MSRADYSDSEIQQALADIKKSGSSTNWIMLGYVPKSDTKLKLVGSGSGGLTEVSDQLNDGKILFSLLSFNINNTTKFAYVSWCGEGVTGMKKGLFNNHANDVAILFKGFHVQINARNESDVEEQTVVDRLKKATGASYDSGAKNQGSSKLVPQSVAQGRQQATQSNAKSKQADKSDYNKKQESEQYWNTDKQQQETDKQAPPKPAPRTEYNKTKEREEFWASQKQQEESKPAPASRQPATGGGSVKARADNVGKQSSQPPQKSAPAPSRPAPAKAAPAAPAPPPPAPEPEPEPEPVEEQPPEEIPPVEEQSYQEEPAPPAQQYEEPVAEQPVEQYQEEQPYQEEQQYQEEQTYQEEPRQEEQPQENLAGGGQARALYDYEGESANDLSFREGDIISIIDKSDPSGWWEGELNGATGFFPSNFVEEIV